MEAHHPDAVKNMEENLQVVKTGIGVIRRDMLTDFNKLADYLFHYEKEVEALGSKIKGTRANLDSVKKEILIEVEKMSKSLKTAEKDYNNALLERIITTEISLENAKRLKPLKDKRRKELESAGLEPLTAIVENMEGEASNL